MGAATAAGAIAAILAHPWLAWGEPAALVDSLMLSRRGEILELWLSVKGRAPKIHSSAHGNELWIDFRNTRLEIPNRPLRERESAPIKAIQAVDRGGLRSRLVVEAGAGTDYAIAQTAGSVVLLLAPAGRVPNLAATLFARVDGGGTYHRRMMPRSADAPMQGTPPPRPSLQASAGAPAHQGAPPGIAQAPAWAAGSPLVMIDPGHGGEDPGAQAASGVREKDLALEISRRLALALNTLGVRTELTRDGDYYVTLPRRTRRANLKRADLFVSIHLNSSPNPGAAGVEVFYLDNTTERATARLARMENVGVTGAGAPRDANLNYILVDLRQNYKAAESAALARLIGAEAAANLDAQLGLSVNALGAKKGPFYVLVGARMPAVLVECGFLSNPDEARRLASPRYQEILARGIASAIVHYLSADAAVGNL